MGLFKCLFVTIVTLAIIIGSAILVLNFTLAPQYEGLVQHSRSDIGKIEIHREQPYGIPHVNAENRKDALYGLGYVHAQDRLFSMHIKRRLSQGRLSEFGEEQTLETDIFFRTVGIADTIKKVVQNMDDEQRDYMTAYINGINDCVHSMKMLPIEFHILGEKFEDWTLEDCISIELMLNLFLSLDFYFEPLKDLVREKYGHELAEEIFAMREKHLFEKTYTLDENDLKQENLYKAFEEEDFQNHFETLRDKHVVDKTHLLQNFVKMTQIEVLENNYAQMKGSNAWVVDGNLTATGKPILANDPHLDIIIPSIWYQVELLFKHEGKDKFAIGTTIPGYPCVIIGRSSYAGWGITNNMADSNDLYIEKIQGNKYFHENKWIEMKEREEVIKIGKSGKQKVITVHETHHGPVLPSMLDLCDFEKPFKTSEQYSFSWPGSQVNNNLLQSNLKLIVAEETDELVEVLRSMTDPVVNIVYATVDGNIGHVAVGRVPIRHDPLNFYPLDGTKQVNDWIKFYKGEEQPQIRNPQKHFTVTANNKVAPDSLVHHITATSTTHGRSYRITQQLEKQIKEGKKFTLDDMKNIQQDRYDAYCIETKPDFLKLFELYQTQYFTEPENQAKITKIYEILKQWPCEMAKNGPNSAGAAVYGIWEQRMLVKYFNDLTDDQYMNNRVAMNLMFDHFFFHHIQDWAQGQKTNKQYCMTETSKNSEHPCVFNFFESVVQTYDLLQKFFPNQPSSEWRWGAINNHEFIHSPFSATPLQPIFGRKREGGGNRRTPNVGGVNLLMDKWRSLYSANFRMVLDMSENGESYYIIETGSSESIFSKHYTDQMDGFLEGEYLPMKYSHKQLGSYQQILTIQFQNNNNKTSESDL